jgi:hypothetical protein
LLKNQQFLILKFSSDRLKKSGYNIDISLDNARINGEVISISNSELVRTLFRYKKINFSQKELNYMLSFHKKLKKLENTEENRKKLENITQKIEGVLLIEDLVSIEFKNKSHYLAILKNKGFYVNGIRFTPFMASAGMIRKNTALFINNNLKHPIMDILENGRNESKPMVAAKFGAYFSLYSSSTLPVSFPNFAVVPDKEIETLRKVNFVEYRGIGEDDEVTEQERLLKLNAWDGQGLITPALAERWSQELEMDYTFSSAIIRAPFLKGLVTVFDLVTFSEQVAGTHLFTDIYGDTQDIRNIDLIISESMFKLWSSYENTESYVFNCNENKLGFSIAKVNPKKEKSYSRTSYQFLQVLNLDKLDVAKLCEPTEDWFRKISGDNAEAMLLYATGETAFEPKDFNKMDVTIKAVLLNPALSKDRYIQDRFIKTIEKKRKESYMGSILINANYSFMIGDPYGQAAHVFGLDKHLLEDGQHYCSYWINRGVKQVGAIRSPIVHHSEFQVLNLQDREDTNKWYAHIHSGVIFPANGVGIDCLIHGGSDFDGDLLCTLNNETMIKGKIEGLPIVYESQKAEKVVVDSRNDKEQVESQLNGYNSKVGFATNISSSLYTMLEEFPEGSPEKEAIRKRLIIGRAIQGEIIDGVKGLKVPPFRNHWTKFKKITEDMSPEEKEKQEFYNKIVCEVRPSFFRFLYSHYMTKYNKEIKKYNTYCTWVFGKKFSEVMASTSRTPEEEEIVNQYKKHSFFLDNESTVNKVSHYMRMKSGLIGKFSKNLSLTFNYELLKDTEIETNVYAISRMKVYLQEYKTFKRGLWKDLEHVYSNIDSFVEHLRKECFTNISSNEAELANYAIEITYGDEVSMAEFCWKMFPQGLLQNLIKNSSGTVQFPMQDDNGPIEYLWNRYSIQEFTLEDLYGWV